MSQSKPGEHIVLEASVKSRRRPIAHHGELMSPLAVNRLRTNWLVDPLGIDDPGPTMSWEPESGRRQARQSAYQVVAATSTERLVDEPDLWDSGRVASAATLGVEYGGPPL